MQVQCMLCDKVETIDDQSFLAKRYRNHPLKTHLCRECYERIREKSLKNLERRRQRKENATDRT